MMTARRAFAKALHLAPRQGSSWGDVSATFYHEAQLRRAHPRLDPNQAHQLRTSAERLMRGLHRQPFVLCLLPSASLHARESFHLPWPLAICKWHLSQGITPNAVTPAPAPAPAPTPTPALILVTLLLCCHPEQALQSADLMCSMHRLQKRQSFTGGVRLEPASAALWAGLGTCAKQPQDQEYAFTRSLHLDPKSAHTWAALGRLYMESGARSLADTCFTQARSQEPADSATWAAMGALAGLSPTGELPFCCSAPADFLILAHTLHIILPILLGAAMMTSSSMGLSACSSHYGVLVCLGTGAQ